MEEGSRSHDGEADGLTARSADAAEPRANGGGNSGQGCAPTVAVERRQGILMGQRSGASWWEGMVIGWF